MKIQIKNRFDLKVIFECEADSLRIAVELAIKQKTDLSGANLSGANLYRADLSMADLSRADLSMADLSMANLSMADLSRADLSMDNLSGANLSMANLSKANLYMADLSGANLYGEKLDKNPIQLLGLRYFVMITKLQIQIGCEIHKVEEWESFDDRRILEMDGKKALIWWRIYKPIIMSLHKEYYNNQES